MLKSIFRHFSAIACVLFALTGGASAQGKQPNILVIWGDDIGTTNISHNNRGLMGYQTPNIDRIAKEGVVSAERADEIPKSVY